MADETARTKTSSDATSMARTLLWPLAITVAIAGAAVAFSRGGGGGCDPPPALAVASVVMATSCPARVTFEGRTYDVSGWEFHESWIGPRIAEQGDTEFGGAFHLRTFSTDDVIVLGRRPNASKEGFSLGIREGFDDFDAAKIQQPFEASR